MVLRSTFRLGKSDDNKKSSTPEQRDGEIKVSVHVCLCLCMIGWEVGREESWKSKFGLGFSIFQLIICLEHQVIKAGKGNKKQNMLFLVILLWLLTMKISGSTVMLSDIYYKRLCTQLFLG